MLHAPVAQLVEQLTCNQQVVSSNLTGSSNYKKNLVIAKFFSYNENVMNYQEYLQVLLNYGEEKYAKFSANLTNSDYNVIGVRIPILRKVVKDHYRDENLLLSTFELGQYLEIDISYLAIGFLRCQTVAEQLAFLKDNMKIAKSWVVTDIIASYCKKITFEDYWQFFIQTCDDEHIYVRRFAFVFGLKFYRDKKILQTFSFIKDNEDYMVYMGQAWLLATIAICYPHAVYDFLRKGASLHLKNKTIAKIKESYRIDNVTKNQFVGLRKA